MDTRCNETKCATVANLTVVRFDIVRNFRERNMNLH